VGICSTRTFLAALCLVSALLPASVNARANLSGLWWDPNESGWGVTLDHQAQFLFVTFFIYGEGGTPLWLVAQLDAPTAEQKTFTGPVYTTTGTPFSRPFVPGDTKPTQVGTATFTVQSDNRLSIAYTVNGTNVSKTVVRQTTKALSIIGAYDGLATTGPFNSDSTDFTITAAATGVLIKRDAFFAGTCEFSGTPTQYGYRLSISGTYRCSDFSTGTWVTEDLTVQDGLYLMGSVTKTPAPGSQPTLNPSAERWIAYKIR
jgi:hypothetical protein